MKRALTFLLLFLSATALLFPQLRIYQNGNLGIFTQEAPLSKVGINTLGNSFTQFSMDAQDLGIGMSVVRMGGTTADDDNTYRTGIFAKSEINGSGYYVGIRGVACQSAENNYLTSGNAMGVYGVAGGGSNCYNYGVVGAILPSTLITGSNGYGAGIYGSDNSNSLLTRIDGRYAGYFKGNVYVTGYLRGTLLQGSDVRYKKNIIELQSVKTKVTDRLSLLNPIEYELINNENNQGMKMMSEGEKEPEYDDSEEPIVYKKKHYGLIAQELQELYPDLVYEQDNGYLAVNYIEIIPLLIQSVKELSEENQQQNYLIRQLINGQSFNKKSNAPQEDVTSFETSLATEAILYQNTPNPFTQSTQISYYLPESITVAYLCIYDLHGKQLKQIKLAERGNSFQIISGSEFQAGIYLYALLADGKEVDVKRMILTN